MTMLQQIKTRFVNEAESVADNPVAALYRADVGYLLSVNSKLVDALRFYAKKTNYIQLPLRPDGNSSTDIIGSPIDKDDGKIAKQTLAEIGG